MAQDNNILTRNEATREYTLDRNRLDPYSNWLKSRRTIGDFQGSKLSGRDRFLTFSVIPGVVDRAVTYTIQGEDELVGFIKAVDPNLQDQEGLRYMYFGERPPNSQEEYNFLNYYVYKNPSYRLTEQEVKYKSFAADLLKNMVNTASHIFSRTKENDLLHLRRLDRDAGNRLATAIIGNILQEDMQFGTLDDEMSRQGISPNLWDRIFRRAARDQITVPGYNFGEYSVYTMVYGSIDQAMADFTPEPWIALIQQILIRSLLQTGLVTPTQLFTVGSTEYSFRKESLKVITPYVKNSENMLYLSRGSVNSSALRSEYKSYDPEYEEVIKEKEIPEDLLPNMYVKRYYRSSMGFGVSREERGQQDARIDKYRSVLRLAYNRVRVERLMGQQFYQDLMSALRGNNSARFYSLYSELLEAGYSVPDELKKLNRNAIMGLAESQHENGGFGVVPAPMVLGVKLTGEKDSLQEYKGKWFSSYVGQVSARTRRDPSVAVLQNLLSHEGAASSQYLYATEYLYNNQSQVSSRVPVEIKSYNIKQNEGYIFDHLPVNYSASVFQKGAANPTEGDLSTAKQFLLRNAQGRSITGFERLIYEDYTTKSEVLGYKITTTRSDNRQISQACLFGNPAKTIIHEDSQVIYGKEYDASLREYRFVYPTPYNVWTISENIPYSILMFYLGLETLDPQEFFEEYLVDSAFSFMSVRHCGAEVHLVEVPVYDEQWNKANVFEKLPTTNSGNNRAALIEASDKHLGAGGISYPRTSVMDFPPTAPIIQFFPKVNVDDEITLSINVESGKIGTIIPEDGSYDNSLEIVRIGDNNEKIDRMHQHQRNITNIPPNRMFFKNKGKGQIKNVILYRTTEMDLHTDTYNDLYKSFNPNGGLSGVSVRKFTTDRKYSTSDNELTFALSYDLTDNVQPNVNYYYTCIVEDVHGNISNPSTIYRIRLLSENGLVIPEISSVVPAGAKRQSPDKNLSRFVKIDASNIQTFPYIQNRNGETVSARSLASVLGSSIEDDNYIVRFTSKDTGRKFDLKLNFVIKVDGRAI